MTTTVRLSSVDPVLRALDGVILELERAWLPEVEPSPDHHGWTPLPLHVFLPALWAAFSAAERRPAHFLDVGAGLGTKLLLAQNLYRHDIVCKGIELRREFVHVAFQHGLAVEQADAADWIGYGGFDIVYLYRPCVDPEMEARLERRVTNCMRPGAVLILACGETQPTGWELIPEGALVPWCQVWQKPH